MIGGIRLLVFDWDGTLMDSEARILSCVKGAAADLNLDIPTDGAIRNIIGLGLKEAVLTLFPQLDTSGVDGVVSGYRRYYLDTDKTPSELFADTRGVLQELSHRGYLLAVATGKGRRGLDQVLDATDLRAVFHTTRCADEAYSKPHPEMLLQILDELGVEAPEAIMIGDTEYDLLMATNAGVPSIGVSYGAHERERLDSCEPLAVLDEIKDLVNWLDQNIHPTEVWKVQG
ncbi:MAG: HAD-IA family hydrolase [Gammaproteobacteria bacterium]|nr:HAD-IA family hydrolase [Gammaproteobacteria bacterium]